MPAADTTPAKLPLRAAMEAGDIDAVVAAFAPGAVLRSPLTSGLVFTGREQIGAVVQVILDEFSDLRYTDELRGPDSAFLVSWARVGGQDIQVTDHLRLGPDGAITELTVYFRPLTATTAALSAILGGLGRRRGPVRARLMAAFGRPLAVLTRAGDGVGVRLVRGCL